MCGIFAYSGPQNVTEILLKGLKNLEYRGYDSAGMAFFHLNRIHRFRVCGELSQLKKKLKKLPAHHSLGIGHTRWATHGEPSEINAHPHRSQFIYVVHNGVIENTEEIKQIIHPKSLFSETDTELIPHLIHHFYQNKSLNFLQSIFKSLPLLKGSYAVVAINEKQPSEMIAFKSGPPLILCRKDKDFFISSDLQALEEQNFEVIFLEDEELAFLKNNQVQLFNFKGQKIYKKFKKHSQAKRDSTKGKHPHFMLKEILEQDQTLKHLIDNHIGKNTLDLKLSKGNKKELNTLLKNSSEILILACGSSYYAGLFAKYVLEDIAKIKVSVEMASEFIYRKTFMPAKTLPLFISQSGETADILTAFKQIKKWNLQSLSLCNVKNSSLDRKTDFSLSLFAGAEVAVASTKAFSASILSLCFLAFHIAKLKKCLKQEKSFVQKLLSLPLQIEQVLSCDQFFLKMMEKLKSFKAFFYLGRGLYYPMALEGALKLKEIAYLHAEAYPSGEMKHGPLAMIDKNTAVLALLNPSGLLYKKSLTNLKTAKSRGAYLITIGGDEKDKELRLLSDQNLPLPKTHKLFHPLLALIPLQMMAYYISRSYGYNADKPRNLAKSVTVE